MSNISIKLIKKDPIKADELKNQILVDLKATKCLKQTAINFGYKSTVQLKKFLKALNFNYINFLQEITKITEDQKCYIIEQYKLGKGIATLSKELNIAFNKIKQILIDNGLSLRTKLEGKSLITTIKKEKIIHLNGADFTLDELENLIVDYKAKVNQKQLLAKYSLSKNQLNKIINNYKLPRRKNKVLFKEFILKNREKLLIYYQTHTIVETANYFNISRASLSVWLKKNNLEHPVEFAHKIQQEKTKATMLERYGTEDYLSTKEVRLKIQQTVFAKYGVDNCWKNKEIRNKISKTIENKYGVKNVFQAEEIKQKIKKTNFNKYGNECYTKTIDYKEKAYLTKKKNNSFSSSRAENLFYEKLCDIFNKEIILRQYKDLRYPFNCDFYIKAKDLFIELNLHWTHGGHKFNNSKEDLQKLNRWKEKAKYSKYYEQAISVWTERDINKWKTAKENNLNYICLYTDEEIQNFIVKLKNEKNFRNL